MSSETTSLLFDTREAASYLDISRSAIVKAVRTGRLKVDGKGNRGVNCFRVESLIAYRETCWGRDKKELKPLPPLVPTRSKNTNEEITACVCLIPGGGLGTIPDVWVLRTSEPNTFGGYLLEELAVRSAKAQGLRLVDEVPQEWVDAHVPSKSPVRAEVIK